MATKSGTRQFHGDAFEYVRNDRFDANPWEINRGNPGVPGDAPKTPLKWNDYGYTLGGPFYIPGHYNTDKSKTFFYWSQDWRKYREGQSIGAMVTLRGEKMYEFLDRLINIALPRVRDFRGVATKSFDGRGNYTLGIRDHLIFPEIDVAKVDKSKGMNITIVTTAKNDEQARFLLREMGMPFGK